MTGGGGNTAMYASWMPANFWFSAPAIAPAVRPLRSSKSLSGKNTSAALDCAAKPLADMPANCTESSTPGCCLGDLAHAPHDFVGAVDRRGRRQLHDAHQVQLVLLRDEARRRLVEAEHGQRHEAGVDGDRDRRTFDGARQRRANSASLALREHPVEAREEAAEQLVHAARQRIRLARRAA